MSEKMLELVWMATLAASGHNTQPWKFAIKDNEIEIHPDYSRRLPIVDPHDRELWMSLGCALENLLIAVRADGYAPEVTYPDPTRDFIRVRLAADTVKTSPLLAAIPLRQNTRSEYDGQLINGLALQMTALDLKSAFLNQPIEVANIRGQFQSAVGLGDALLQLLIRFGYGKSMPRSLRRAVEQVIV